MQQDRFEPVKIWDAWVRLFHWSLAISVSLLIFTGETGIGFFDWHKLLGEFVLALLVFRLLWGLWGSSNAQLFRLFVNPKKALIHLKQVFLKKPEPESGHNAAGGWAVLAMLFLLGVQAVTGLFIADEDEFIEGVFYSSVDSSTAYWLYDIHHTNALLLKIILAVHIAMVFFYLLYAKQNLILPMITGIVRWPSNVPRPTVRLQHFVLGLVSCLIAFAAVGFLVGWY